MKAIYKQYHISNIPANSEHKKNIQKFAKEFIEGFRVMAYLPDIKIIDNKKIATLLIVTAILINRKIEDKQNKSLLNTFQFIEIAKKIINCKFDYLDTLCTYKAIDKIIEGRHYFNDNSGRQFFLVREDIENLTTVKLLPYE